ncbi:glutamate racemase [Cytophagaceae bacterium YF14B1]|uniref:Glutamate racemase n=1 Tax=Xanthocytophaga flava TaxID=3048013 RepID=A0AAE3QVH3_9BACT|nr:glutamate racemase [Xanthocytophaga flavus]MDJ1484153.1 glutamate racemase [Xanthocytophaga flavus]
MTNENPIGIFDSGIGGLTVAQAVTKALPHESIVYFGDTAHLPYGDKSAAAIQAYSVKICDVLLKQNCKMILIACNSASAAAYELVKEYVGSKAKVLNVIDPVVQYAGQQFASQTIGLIGTKQTVFSKVYEKKIKALKKKVTLKSLATPLLAPMIEEGFFNNTISYSVIEKYLQDSHLNDIQALILGCTHYPLIKKEIEQLYKNSIQIIDTSEIVAEAVKESLRTENLLSASTAKATQHFFVSDYTQSFEASTRIFFNKKVHLEQYKLWE